jgi:hypothetical protein
MNATPAFLEKCIGMQTERIDTFRIHAWRAGRYITANAEPSTERPSTQRDHTLIACTTIRS